MTGSQRHPIKVPHVRSEHDESRCRPCTCRENSPSGTCMAEFMSWCGMVMTSDPIWCIGGGREGYIQVANCNCCPQNEIWLT